MKRALLLFVPLLLTANVVRAQSESKPDVRLDREWGFLERSITGAGTVSCARFVQFYSQTGHQSRRNEIYQWVWGFLAAYNVRGNFEHSLKPAVALPKIPDSTTIFLYLSMYCQKNPDNSVLDGAFALIRSLGGEADWKSLRDYEFRKKHYPGEGSK
jgi:hypothetical protein